MTLQKNRNEHSEASIAKTRPWSSIIVIVGIIAVAAGIAFLLTRRGAETKDTDSLSVETISSPEAGQAAAPISPIASNEHSIKTLDDWEVDATQAQEGQETEALVMEANAFYDQGDYEKAIELLTISIDVSESPRLYNDRGNAYLQLGFTDLALEDYEAALGIDPNFAHAHYNRGRLYLLTGRYENAIRDLEKVAASSNEAEADLFYPAKANLALAYYYNKQNDKAFEVIEQAIKEDSTKVTAYRIRGDILYDLGDLDLAIEDYRTAIALEPRYSEAQLRLGEALFTAGRYKEAIEPLEKAKELMALSPAPHFYLGASYLAVGQNNQARAAYEEGISRAETLDNEESNRVIDSAINRLRILISQSPQIEAPATTFITMLEAAKADN